MSASSFGQNAKRFTKEKVDSLVDMAWMEKALCCAVCGCCSVVEKESTSLVKMQN